MLKGFLIALATLVSYDAVAWESTFRHQIVRAATMAIAKAAALDWSWG
jgi:hypothetical protein